MILVLNIKNKDQATWSAVEDNKVLYSHDFDLPRGEEKLLFNLDKFLKKNKLALTDFKALALSVQKATLTQVKIITTIVNTLAWQFDWPIVGQFYTKFNLNSLLTGLNKQIFFKALKVEYSRPADITLSKKKAKYKIGK